MKLLLALLAGASSTQAFITPQSRSSGVVTSTSRSFSPDFFPSADYIHAVQDILSTNLWIADASELTAGAADAVGDAVSDSAEQASKSGWFGFLTGPIMGLLQIIHNLLVTGGVSANAWGVSIIVMTVLIKLATFPLTKTQLESTNKMQAMQPALKEIQSKYQSNPEVMNQKIAEFYQTNNINPLAGCLPSLVQIPIFIGLYRAVLDLAQQNKLSEPFLWLPSLEGPTYGADPTSANAWLFQGWVDGVPSLGWDDTISFLILPVLLVISQFASMELMQPKNSESSNNVVLKLLPLMIGWFSLNVPAALCVYWFTNNIITTSISLFIRSNMDMSIATASSSEGSATSTAPTSPIFTQPREKPAGFGGSGGSSASTSNDSSDGVKRLTKVMDAEVVDDDEDDDGDGDDEDDSVPTPSDQPKKKRGGGKKKKKKSN